LRHRLLDVKTGDNATLARSQSSIDIAPSGRSAMI